MGQDGASVDQIKLRIECRRRLEQDSKRGRLEQDSKRGRLEQDSKRGRLGKQQDRVQGRAGQEAARQVQDEVSESAGLLFSDCEEPPTLLQLKVLFF
ncbi:hypothetical protein XELAEV_18000173mg [Xenopus laevis]|uniref:Uncharacterized protein n=1 Tax=Xenopus laevis TaxID=8355 RepID=A0A974BQR7_XENLA|nr:hypothetical protein XELAEV_18000173mg [Xenopus laevis]